MICSTGPLPALRTVRWWTQTEITTVALTKCRTEPAVALYAAAPVSGYGHADDIVTYSFDLPESIAATVKSGSVVQPPCIWTAMKWARWTL